MAASASQGDQDTILGIVQDHAVRFARVDGELATLARGQEDISTKLDRVMDAMGKFEHRPRLPAFREIIISLAAGMTFLVGAATGATYWSSSEFEKHAKDFKAEIAAQRQASSYERQIADLKMDYMKGELDRVKSYVQVKPAFRDWAAEVR